MQRKLIEFAFSSDAKDKIEVQSKNNVNNIGEGSKIAINTARQSAKTISLNSVDIT